MALDETFFELTADHVTLIQNMWVGWQDGESGAPAIDPKRPYGNSDVARDVADLLEVELPEDDDGYIPAEIESQLMAIHRSTEVALQIYLKYGDAIGTYRRPKYSIDWEPV